MADTQNSSYLSIGEVLGLLLEEFPDVTISKIRFLESQGLISPERTPSGYRKFYDDDVQRLRVILAEQRENYLPLRVIKDRLENGEIDPTGEQHRPDDAEGTPSNGVPSADVDEADATVASEQAPTGEADPAAEPDRTPADAAVPASSVASHPSSRHQPSATPTSDTVDATAERTTSDHAGRHDDSDADEPDATAEDDGHRPSAAQLLPGVLLDRAELCSMVGMTDDELSQLESFGIVVPRESTGVAVYGDDAVEIAVPACEFLRAGIDARHLRNWRTSAEREASLFEQLVAPRFRQRNPAARAEALDQLRRLDELGGQLRGALTKHALRHHFDT